VADLDDVEGHESAAHQHEPILPWRRRPPASRCGCVTASTQDGHDVRMRVRFVRLAPYSRSMRTTRPLAVVASLLLAGALLAGCSEARVGSASVAGDSGGGGTAHS